MSKKSMSQTSGILLGEVRKQLSKVEEARRGVGMGSDESKLISALNLFNAAVVLFLNSALEEVAVSWDRREVKAGNRVHFWVQVPSGFKFKFPFEVIQNLDEGLSEKVEKKMKAVEKLYFPTKEEDDYRPYARLMTCISRDTKRLSIESQIPDALEALPEATRPHPLAVRGVQNFAGYILIPYVFGWAIVPPWEMGTDSLEELQVSMEAVLNGELSFPEDETLISESVRDYYLREAQKRREKREHDAQKFQQGTWNWNGYSGCAVMPAASRREAIRSAIAAIGEIRRGDKGGKVDNSLLGAMVLFDDGQRILFHIEDGYDFYGMRVHHTYIYFDPDSKCDDEDSYENYEVHTLSMTNGELWTETRWGLG